MRILLVALLLLGCNGVVAALRVDAGAGADDAHVEGTDGSAPDAWSSTTDDAALEADAGVDAALEADAGSDVGTDAFVPTDAPDLTPVPRSEACARAQAVFETETDCLPDLFGCGFSASATSVPEARVEACEEAIRFGFSEASGPADHTSRCNRAATAAGACHEWF